MQAMARIESNVMDYSQFSGVTPNVLVSTLECMSGISLGEPLDVERLAAMINLRIDDRLDIEQLARHARLTCYEGRARLWINPVCIRHPIARRWVIARAIGHLILHLDDLHALGELTETGATLVAEPNGFANKGRDQAAARFAARLLMPADAVRRHGERVIARYQREAQTLDRMSSRLFVLRMADLFEVDKAVAKARLMTLSVVDSDVEI